MMTWDPGLFYDQMAAAAYAPWLFALYFWTFFLLIAVLVIRIRTEIRSTERAVCLARWCHHRRAALEVKRSPCRTWHRWRTRMPNPGPMPWNCRPLVTRPCSTWHTHTRWSTRSPGAPPLHQKLAR